jgi:hypothetical protein
MKIEKKKAKKKPERKKTPEWKKRPRKWRETAESEESNRNSVQDGIENFPGVFASAQSPNRQILSNCKFLRGGWRIMDLTLKSLHNYANKAKKNSKGCFLIKYNLITV